MKFKLLLRLFLFHVVIIISITAGFAQGCGDSMVVVVNGRVAYLNVTRFLTFSPKPEWAGFAYVANSFNSVSGYNIGNYVHNTLTTHIYIHPGDSAAINDSIWGPESYDKPGQSRTYYGPGYMCNTLYWGNGCQDLDVRDSIIVIIEYLSDSLELQYQELRQQAYLIKRADSILVVDSLRSADSLATIRSIVSHGKNIIYPNPTSGILNFTNYYYNQGLAEIKVFDVSGEEVIRQNFEVEQGLQSRTLDIGNLPNGVYLVQYTSDGYRRMEKVVKI